MQMKMEKLPPEQREIIELIYFEGMTQSQVAQTLTISVNTVKSRVRLALRKLRHEFRIERQESL